MENKRGELVWTGPSGRVEFFEVLGVEYGEVVGFVVVFWLAATLPHTCTTNKYETALAVACGLEKLLKDEQLMETIKVEGRRYSN